MGAELISCSGSKSTGDFMLFGTKTAAFLGKLWRKLLFVQAPLLCQLGALNGQDPPLSPGRWESRGCLLGTVLRLLRSAVLKWRKCIYHRGENLIPFSLVGIPAPGGLD